MAIIYFFLTFHRGTKENNFCTPWQSVCVERAPVPWNRIVENKSSMRWKEFHYPVASHFHEYPHPVFSLRRTGTEHVKLYRGDLDKWMMSLIWVLWNVCFGLLCLEHCIPWPPSLQFTHEMGLPYLLSMILGQGYTNVLLWCWNVYIACWWSSCCSMTESMWI